MSEIQALLERQALWQKTRRALPWPEKIRMAEGIRESALQLRRPQKMDFDSLPGGVLVRQGLADIAAGRDTEAALLVLIGSPRLRRLGISIAVPAPPQVEHQLYERLQRTDPDAAHSRYNALLRLLVSFERAAECAG